MNDWCPYKKREIWTHTQYTETQKRDSHMQMEAEIRVMHVQAKERQRFVSNPADAKRDKEAVFPRAFRRSVALLTP